MKNTANKKLSHLTFPSSFGNGDFSFSCGKHFENEAFFWWSCDFPDRVFLKRKSKLTSVAAYTSVFRNWEVWNWHIFPVCSPVCCALFEIFPVKNMGAFLFVSEQLALTFQFRISSGHIRRIRSDKSLRSGKPPHDSYISFIVCKTDVSKLKIFAGTE